MVGWFVGWLVGWLVVKEVSWLLGWLFGQLVGWLVAWLVRWLVSWLVGLCARLDALIKYFPWPQLPRRGHHHHSTLIQPSINSFIKINAEDVVEANVLSFSV